MRPGAKKPAPRTSRTAGDAASIASAMSVPVNISAWKPAPFALGGETVFAVGDVHGCARELASLLDAMTTLARERPGERRLVYLGDIIDRGPDTIGALKLWAGDAASRGVDRIDRVMGNHEMIMLLPLAGSPHAAKAEAMWLSEGMGGGKVLEEMRLASGDPRASLSQALAVAAFGEKVMGLLTTQRSHARRQRSARACAGRPARSGSFLSPPRTEFTEALGLITRGFRLAARLRRTLVVHTRHRPHWPLATWKIRICSRTTALA